jgi:hypothetical protein
MALKSDATCGTARTFHLTGKMVVCNRRAIGLVPIKVFYFNSLILNRRSRDKALAAATAGAAAINAGPSEANGLAFAMRRCDPASGSL